MPGDHVVLDLPGLRVEAEPRPSWFDRWFETRIVVDAPPFGGVLEAIFADEDLAGFADALDRLDPAGRAVLGGDRAAELVLDVVEPSPLPNTPPGLVVECSLTPSGDDPYPSLTWLIFHVPPFARAAAERLRAAAATDPWPTPPR